MDAKPFEPTKYMYTVKPDKYRYSVKDIPFSEDFEEVVIPFSKNDLIRIHRSLKHDADICERFEVCVLVDRVEKLIEKCERMNARYGTSF